jgi:hypothetical protein
MGDGWYACTDVVLMIDAPGFMCGTASRHSQNIA